MAHDGSVGLLGNVVVVNGDVILFIRVRISHIEMIP